MKIEEISIKNFRGLDLDFNNLKQSFLIIGKNDSGKSNFCYAIRKVLDYNIRKLSFVQSDSTDSNLGDISVKLVLNIDSISDNNRAILREWIDSNDDESESITVELYAKYNEDTSEYDEHIVFGSIDKSSIKSASNGNELDKILDLLYVYPNYDLSRDISNFFSFHKQENNKNGVSIGHDVIEGISNLNNLISTDKVVELMQNELNDIESMRDLFDDVSFDIKSDFDLSNIYKSLKIFPVLSDGRSISVGDGKSKTLALLLQKNIKRNDKEKIIILEEPENHLYPLLQKHYASNIDNFGYGQIIITTHSPSIIDFRKTEEIFKFSFEYETGMKKFCCYRTNIDSNQIYKDFGFSLNEEIAESFFYNQVLLVEGYSEKYFYNRLINSDENFRSNIIKRSFGFICIYGIDFKPAKQILNSLGIKVHILTDNDVYGVPRYPNKKRFAGIQRALDILSKEELDKLNHILGFTITDIPLTAEEDSNDFKRIIENMTVILEALYGFGIYIHPLNENGFECAFSNFIGLKGDEKQKVISELKDSKMKNLHHFLTRDNYDLKVSDSNISNILVRFAYDDKWTID